MVREFNSIEDIEKYYNEETNTYIFKEYNEYIDLVIFNFDLTVEADIKVRDINANNISAWDINAWDINARDISYYAICIAYKNIKCNSIRGARTNSKHFVLDGKIEVEE